MSSEVQNPSRTCIDSYIGRAGLPASLVTNILGQAIRNVVWREDTCEGAGVTTLLDPQSQILPTLPPQLVMGMNIILSLSVQFSSHSEPSITLFQFPNLSMGSRMILLCPERAHDCLQIHFRLSRHDKDLVLMF